MIPDKWSATISATSRLYAVITHVTVSPHATFSRSIHVDQEIADAAAYSPGRRGVCVHQMAALFACKNSVGAAPS